jgi:hypothetical protein
VLILEKTELSCKNGKKEFRDIETQNPCDKGLIWGSLLNQKEDGEIRNIRVRVQERYENHPKRRADKKGF